MNKRPNKKTIEQLFAQSGRPVRVLSSAKKEALWLRIQKDAEQDTAVSVPSVEQARPWWKRSWFVLGMPAMALAVVVFAFAVARETPTQEHLADEVPANTANANTPTNDVPVYIANAGRVEANRIIDELLVDGRGGGPDTTNYASWIFSYSKTLSTQQFVANEYSAQPFNEQQMRTIAAAFNISAPLTAVTHLGWDSYLTTVPEQATAGCRGARHWGQNIPLTQPRCLFIDSRGLVDLEQTEAAAQADALKEAKSYIQQVTGVAEAELIIEPVQIAIDTNYQTVIFDQYYTIYLPVEEKDGIPFYPYAWHAALNNGKLVSLYGQLFQSQPSSQQDDIISPQEAYDRMKTDFAHMNGGEDDTFDWVFVSADNRVLSNMGMDTLNMHIDIESMDLQYEVLVHSREKGIDDIRLVPLYRIQGMEQGTDNRFEAYMDATRQGELGATYRLFNILVY